MAAVRPAGPPPMITASQTCSSLPTTASLSCRAAYPISGSPRNKRKEVILCLKVTLGVDVIKRRRLQDAIKFPDRRRMPTAARTFTSVQMRLRANKATGSPPFPAGGISPSSGSTARPKPPSTRVGSLATSRRSSDVSAADAGGEHDADETTKEAGLNLLYDLLLLADFAQP